MTSESQAASPHRATGRRRRRGRRGWATILLLAPATLLFATFVLYPIAASLWLSLHDWNGVGPQRYVGFANYRELAADPIFWQALGNNLRWLACYLVAPLAGAALAVFLNQQARGMRAVRSLFFMPFVVSQVAVGIIFVWFFHSRFGLYNELRAIASWLPATPLDSERWSLFTMIAAGLWPQTAYCMILFLAGLAAVSGESVDAGRVDGARGWSLFRYVVLPELRPVTIIVGMVCAVSALRSFDYVMIMTVGGPFDSSTVLAYYMYEQTFVASRYGYGAAIAAVLLALMSAIIVVLMTRMFRRERG